MNLADIRRNNFDALRLLLAVLVIYSHCYPLSRGAAASDGLAFISNNQIDGGSLAVDGFFVISGFLIAHSWMTSPRLGRFLARRGRRIIPGYLSAMLFCALVVAPIACRPWYFAFSGSQLASVFVRTLLLTAYPESTATFAANPYPSALNGSMWTIQFEFCCYLLLAIAGMLGLLRNKSVVLAGFILAIVWLWLTQSHLGEAAHWRFAGKVAAYADLLFTGNLAEWPRLLAHFLAGATYYSWQNRLPHSSKLAAGAGAAIVLSVLCGELAMVLPIAGAYLLFWIAYHPRIRLENFGRRGDFSYGTYLYAFPLQQLAVHWLPGIRPLALFGLCAPAAVLAGAISWHVVEKRFGAHRSPDRSDAAAHLPACGESPSNSAKEVLRAA